MIHEVDESLRAFIASGAANGSVDVSFDAPNRDWVARRSGPTINVFLYDIREDLERRQVAPMPVRDGSGTVVSRRSPLRRFKLSYLVSAWTQRPEDEHRLLSDLLTRFLRVDTVPRDHLRGSLADSGAPLLLELAIPVGPERSPFEIWNALGGELKPSLDLVVVAPLDPQRTHETGPPVVEEPVLGVAGVDGDHERGRPTRRPLPEGEGIGEEVTAGAVRPGRTMRLRRYERP